MCAQMYSEVHAQYDGLQKAPPLTSLHSQQPELAQQRSYNWWAPGNERSLNVLCTDLLYILLFRYVRVCVYHTYSSSPETTNCTLLKFLCKVYESSAAS